MNMDYDYIACLCKYTSTYNYVYNIKFAFLLISSPVSSSCFSAYYL